MKRIQYVKGSEKELLKDLDLDGWWHTNDPDILIHLDDPSSNEPDIDDKNAWCINITQYDVFRFKGSTDDIILSTGDNGGLMDYTEDHILQDLLDTIKEWCFSICITTKVTDECEYIYEDATVVE